MVAARRHEPRHRNAQHLARRQLAEQIFEPFEQRLSPIGGVGLSPIEHDTFAVYRYGLDPCAADVQCRSLPLCSSLTQHTWCSATDRRPDIAYHRALLSTGVMLEYDHHFRSHLEDGTCPAADLITTLAPEFPDQIVVGMDMARRSYWHGHGGKPGLVWLLTLLPTLLRERGVKHEPRNNPVREVLIQ